ncbi:MAG: DUF3854 domain-containing protein [Proteobacteria bacterium]|nr:DUF3854 domain-containing protein [Pseudomonadota bacterium]
MSTSNGRVPDGFTLSAAHWHELHVGSQISEEVAAARGYRTFTEAERASLWAMGFKPDQTVFPCLLMPMWSPDGTSRAWMVRLPDDRPEGMGKYQFPAKMKQVLDVLPLWRDVVRSTGKTIAITEGVKKADALSSVGIPTIGLAGVWNWRGTSALGGSVPVDDWEDINVVGQTFIIMFDADVLTKTGPRLGRARLTRYLQRRGAMVQWLELPLGPAGKVDDFLRENGGGEGAKAALLARVYAAPDIMPLRADNPDVADLGRQAWNALCELPEPLVMRGGGGLVCVQQWLKGAPTTQVVDAVVMQGTLSDVVSFESASQPAVVPPRLLADWMVRKPDVRVPELKSIATVPFFDAKGQVIDEDGFHGPSETWLALADRPLPVPKVPTAAEVEAAKALILDVMVGEFPFVDEASKAHALSIMLERLLVAVIDAPMPLHIVESASPGTGKGFLTRAMLHPVLGRAPSFKSDPVTDEEWRKVITMTMMAKSPVLCVDNVTQTLKSGALLAAVTTDRWNDRVLGGNTVTDGTIRWSWVVLGNNVAGTVEIMRRAVWTRLESTSATPWTKTDYKIPNLEQWVAQHRREVLQAAMTLCRHWVAQGMKPGSAKLASFEQWSEVIGGVLEACEIPGFLGNPRDIEESSDDEGWTEFVTTWWDLYHGDPTNTSILFSAADPVLELYGKDEDGRRRSFGMQLGKRKGRVYAGKRLILTSARRTWKLVPVDGS